MHLNSVQFTCFISNTNFSTACFVCQHELCQNLQISLSINSTQFQCLLQLCGLHLQYGYLIQFGDFCRLLRLNTLLLLAILFISNSFRLDFLLYCSPFLCIITPWRRGRRNKRTQSTVCCLCYSMKKFYVGASERVAYSGGYYFRWLLFSGRVIALTVCVREYGSW